MARKKSLIARLNADIHYNRFVARVSSTLRMAKADTESRKELFDSLLNTLKCRIGLHHWDYEGDTLNEEGVRVCNLCSRRERGIWVSTDGQSAFIKWLRTFDV